MTDPYLLPSGALRNRLDITDAVALSEAEADISRARLAILSSRPLPGTYDLAHLQRFHATIFGDVYPWAGELRTIDITKWTPFCPARNIRAYADEVFGRLRSASWLRGLSRPVFVKELAALYGDVNALHPFREGNGRAQRAFLAQLANEAGWSLRWSLLSAAENTEASVKSFLGDNGPLELLLDELVGDKPT
ncbi:Fic/DOC family protein [Streptomyces mayteni]